jgi:hypothetical protein
MEKKSFLKNILASLFVLSTRLFARFLGMLPNFSLVGSFGFFNQSPLSFFTTIILFDLIKGGFYPGFWLTYLGFGSYYILGRWAKNNLKRRLALLPVASFLFFLISNFGVWLYWYPQNFEGLIKCYTLAIPFYKNTLLSDLVFGYGFLFLRSSLKNLSQINLNLCH